MNPEAGWYPDPSGGEGLRYWDGGSWTTERSPTPSSGPQLPAQGELSQHATPTKGSVPTALIALGALGVVVVLGFVLVLTLGRDDQNSSGQQASAGGTSGQDDTIMVEYTLQVGDPCYDMGLGYSDIRAGTDVEVFDGDGSLLGFGDLSSGSSSSGSCIFEATFSAERSDDGIYRVTAGNANRGFLNFTEGELVNDTLLVQATLG